MNKTMKSLFKEGADSRNIVSDSEWSIPSNISQFSDAIKETSGVDLNVCYQCRKCYSGCPVAYAMDYTPAQLLHAARLGLKDLVLGSATIWLCASCETCVTRCPQDVDLVKVIDSMRLLALRSKVKPAAPEVAQFYRASLLNIRLFGRLYEIGLIGQLKISTRQLTKDLRLGWEMLKKGKLTLLPSLDKFGKLNKLFSQVQELERRK